MKAAEEVVVVNVKERVATITLNRPLARNALSAELLHLLPLVVLECDTRPDVDVLILTGADPAFCSGLDLKELATSTSALDDLELDVATAAIMRRPLPPVRKPLIGAINGPAITGGLELALACDFLVASDRATFADTHSRVGIMPGWGLSVLLPDAVGRRRAREMSATGKPIDATTALHWGLVNHVVAHDQLLPACREVAAHIASSEQLAVRRMMLTYDEGSLVSAGEAWRIESQVFRDWLQVGREKPED